MELETFTVASLFKKTWKDTDFLSTVIEETKKQMFYIFLTMGLNGDASNS